MPNKYPKKGFTLVELLTVIAIGAIISITTATLFRQTYRSFIVARENLTIQSNARLVFNRMSDELKQLQYLESINENTVVFYRLEGELINPSKIEYTVEGNELIRYHTEAQGTVPNLSYPTEERRRQTMSQMLMGQTEPIFTVFDQTNDQIDYSDLAQIRLIGIKIFFDNEPDKEPAPFVLETAVQLRNLKVN